MVVIHVEVSAKPEMVSLFEIALAEVSSAAADLEGCKKYQWFRVPATHQDFVIYAEFD